MPAVPEEQAGFAPVAFTQVVFGQAAPIEEPPIEEALIEEPMCVLAWAPPPLVQPRSVQQATTAPRDVDITPIRPATKATLKRFSSAPAQTAAVGLSATAHTIKGGIDYHFN
jgi:hypothetical protein